MYFCIHQTEILILAINCNLSIFATTYTISCYGDLLKNYIQIVDK